MDNVLSVILAAGEGKRMKSKKAKVLHEICGRSLLGWVSSSVKDAGVDERIIVVGNRSEQVKNAMGDGFKYVKQEKQLGTGHAVMQARKWLEGRTGTVLILCADTPLVSKNTIRNALEFHIKNEMAATVITTSLEQPFGYGRIIRDETGTLMGIVEQKDANNSQKQIKEINSGMYCFDIKALLKSLDKLTNENSQNEYYLTDTFEILLNEGLKVSPFLINEKEEVLGVNDREQLATAQSLMNDRIIKTHMLNGVSFISPETTFIDADVNIGMDTILYPQVTLKGRTIIGEDCVIGSGSKIVDSKLENGVYFDQSCIYESTVGENCKVGPFAYIRPGSNIGKNVKIGDFVEIKKASIGDNTKVSHLTYVGDAVIENDVNLGCGVVIVNYDGKTKHKTHVKANSFVGCNVNLISPVMVEKGGFIAAGTTVTENVPENALAIGRSRQIVKENWVKNRKGDV